MAPSDFGDPDASIDPRAIRVSPTGLAVVIESPEFGRIAVLPVAGQTPEEYISLRTAAEKRRGRRARVAIALGATFVLSVALAASVFGPGSQAYPFALTGIGACGLAVALAARACLRFPMPDYAAVIPRDLIDGLGDRDVARIRVAAHEGRPDDAVAELVRRRVFGLDSGDTTTTLPVVSAA